MENSIILSSSWWGIFQRPGYHGLRVLHDTITGDPRNGPDSGGEDIGVWNLGGSIQIGYSNISQFGGGVGIVTGDLYDSYLHDEQTRLRCEVNGIKFPSYRLRPYRGKPSRDGLLDTRPAPRCPLFLP